MTERRKAPAIPHGACRVEEWPDGRIVVYFWNADLQRWTYEHPNDHGERGLSLLLWWVVLAIMLAVFTYACTGH